MLYGLPFTLSPFSFAAGTPVFTGGALTGACLQGCELTVAGVYSGGAEGSTSVEWSREGDAVCAWRRAPSHAWFINATW